MLLYVGTKEFYLSLRKRNVVFRVLKTWAKDFNEGCSVSMLMSVAYHF